MKTISWKDFIELLRDDEIIVEVDDVNVHIIINSDDTFSIFWEEDVEEWLFEFSEGKNKELEVNDNYLQLFCDEENVDCFTFAFYTMNKYKF